MRNRDAKEVKSMAKITVTIELTDGSTVTDDHLVSKRGAVRYVRRMKKRGMWICYDQRRRMAAPEEYIFPSEIESIKLKYEPVVIPERPQEESV